MVHVANKLLSKKTRAGRLSGAGWCARCLLLALVIQQAACAGFWRSMIAQSQIPGSNATFSTGARQTAPMDFAPPGKVNERLVRTGYFVQKKGSEQYLYCRVEVPTGTRLVKKVCQTEMDVLMEEKDSADFLDALNSQRGQRCPPFCPPRR